MSTTSKKLNPHLSGFLVVALTGVMVILSLYLGAPENLFLVMLVLFLIMLVLGKTITGRPLGVLVNERNLMSLSRFQMSLWTLIILSAFSIVVFQRVMAEGVEDPLAIDVDWQLWALLGISATSAVGTPLMLSNKQKKVPADKKVVDEVVKAFQPMGETKESVEKNMVGVLYGNERIMDARFADIFEGDELKDTSYIDIAKVQMFFFTIVIAISYVATLIKWIVENDPADLDSFPDISEGLIAILGVSHAGYLGSKAVYHTKTK